MQVGDKAPDFTAQAWVGGEIKNDFSLSGVNKDKIVVLAFYPLDFTSGWTTELSQFRDEIDTFHELGAEVVGVSVDSVHSHRVFAEMHGLPMPLVSDFNKEISEAYGVRVDRGMMKGICHRSIFVIGRDGKISYVWKQEPGGPLPVNDDVREAIRAVRAESKN